MIKDTFPFIFKDDSIAEYLNQTVQKTLLKANEDETVQKPDDEPDESGDQPAVIFRF